MSFIDKMLTGHVSPRQAQQFWRAYHEGWRADHPEATECRGRCCTSGNYWPPAPKAKREPIDPRSLLNLN